MSAAEATSDELTALRSRIEVSVRYHQRRRGFFDGLHTLFQASSLIGSSGAVALILADVDSPWKLAVALVLAISSALGLAVKPSDKAREHARLAVAFTDVDRALTRIDKVTPKRLRALNAKILTIERDEPPTLQVLEAIVRNEYARSLGHGTTEMIPITKWQRRLAHVVDVAPEKLRRQG